MASPPQLTLETSFTPPKSPLKPALRKRLFAATTTHTADEITERVAQAAARKTLMLQARSDACGGRVKRAKHIASQVKQKENAARAHRMAELSARLDAAAERRKHSRMPSPLSSPLAGPSLVVAPPGPKMTFAVPLPDEDAFALPSAAPTEVAEAPALSRSGLSEGTNLLSLAEEAEPAAAAAAEDAPPRPLHEELDAQMETAGGDFAQLAAWLKEPATIGLAAEWLSTLGIDRTLAKRLLALVYMAADSESMFDDTDAADKAMKREALRFNKMYRRQLKRGERQSVNETFAASFTRARRFYQAWSVQDVPKQAAVVDEAMTRLTDALMRARAQQVHAGTESVPPEDILAQIRALGGEEAEAEARAQFDRPWQPVAPQGAAPEAQAAALEARVREVATRALLDALKTQTEAGEYGGLFGILGELHAAMGALVAHSERARDELADKFDAKWIEQQAGAGCLTTDQVHAIMRYLLETIAGWQAPADDADTRAWALRVEATLATTAATPLAEFIPAHLIDFLAGALERVGKVHQRVAELAGQMGALRERAARLDEEEAREGGMGAQD